jgi:hypothetical protein
MNKPPWQTGDLLYRQVHPNHISEGRATSAAFNPTPKDEGKLSVDDARMVTAEASWSHFTGNLGFQSGGTWAVSLEEVGESGSLEVIPDPIVDLVFPNKTNQAHCAINFNLPSSSGELLTKGERKRLAQRLAIHATARGCLWSPPASTS